MADTPEYVSRIVTKTDEREAVAQWAASMVALGYEIQVTKSERPGYVEGFAW